MRQLLIGAFLFKNMHYHKKLILHLEEELINVMKYRLRARTYIDYKKYDDFIKEICDVLEKLYIVEKSFKKGYF